MTTAHHQQTAAANRFGMEANGKAFASEEEAMFAASSYKGNSKTLQAFKDTINYLFNNRLLAVRVQHKGLFQALDNISQHDAFSVEGPSIWTAVGQEGVSKTYVMHVFDQVNRIIHNRGGRHLNALLATHLSNLLDCYKANRSVVAINKAFVQELTYAELMDRLHFRSGQTLFNDTLAEMAQVLTFFNAHTPELEGKMIEEMKHAAPDRFFFGMARHFDGKAPQEFIDAFGDDLRFLVSKYELRQRIAARQFAQALPDLAPFDNVSDLRKFLVTDVELPIIIPNLPENPAEQPEQQA